MIVSLKYFMRFHMIAFGFAVLASPLQATQINTSEETEAYHQKFCPNLRKVLAKQQFQYECQPSQTMQQSAERVEKNPSQLAYAHFDTFALENSKRGATEAFHTIRKDLGRACLFLVTKNKELSNFGQVAAQAKDLRFILPPEGSSHVSTFEYLKQVDVAGLGQAKQIVYSDSLDNAIDDVLLSNDPLAITMFVQYPDPDHPRFKTITKNGGQFIPVIDRNILRQDISGEKIYFAEETEIANANWTTQGVKLITSCTPIVLFTGKTKAINGENAQQDHKDLIRTLTEVSRDQLLPQENFLTKLWKQTKSLSATSIEQLVKASEDARKAAEPALKKTEELSKEALEASKQALEKSKEIGQQAYDRAKDLTDQVLKNMEKAPQDNQQGTPPGSEKKQPRLDNTDKADAPKEI